MKKTVYAVLILLSIQSNAAFSQCGPGSNISQLLMGNVFLSNTANVGVGQSFTATCSGSIESITLHIVTVGVDGDHELTMYDGVNPSNPLSSVIYNLTSVDASNDVLITFPVPIPVISGNEYTFMTKFVTGEAGFSIVITDPYLGGGVQFYIVGNSSFEAVSTTFASWDLYFIVHYLDQISPIAVCENVTVELDASGNIDFSPSIVGSGSSDDSGILTFDIDTTYTCSDIGVNSVILVVFDPSNNSSSCTATITVVDLLAPEIICPGNLDITLSAGTSLTLPDYFTSGDVTIIDNCTTPIVNVIQDPVAGTQVSPGVQTVTITAVDESGNSSYCSFDLNLISTNSLNEFDNSAIEFYPNPVVDVLNIQNLNGVVLQKATIYDIRGNSIIDFDLNEAGTEQKLDVSTLSAGVYLITIQTVEGETVKRLIKNN